MDAQERVALEDIRDNGTHHALKYKRAIVMLLSDESADGESLTDCKINNVTGMTLRTIERLRKRCHEVGALKALERVPHAKPPVEIKITGEVEAYITQIAWSEAPDGHAHWTLQLIADEAMAKGIIESISHTSVGTILKKANLSLGKSKGGVSHQNRTPRL